MTRPDPTRRALVQALLGGVVAGALPFAFACGPQREPEEAGQPLVDAFDEGALREIGRRLLPALPADASAESLAAELFAAPRWRAGGDPVIAFAEQVTSDFAAERVVRVDGWVLARSEALLAALAAMEHDAKP